MYNIWIIAKREYKMYFASPVAYMVIFILLLILGIFFYLNVQVATSQLGGGYVPGVDSTLSPLAVLLMLITPALTTRLLAEEQRLGTIELMLTAPVRDWELVVGKWLGAFLLQLTIVAITFIYPLILNQLVKPGIDQGPLVSGYLGMILLCAALVGVGVMVSSFFSNQIAAFATTMGVLIFLWWIIGPIGQVAGAASTGSELISYFDFNGHYMNNLLQGVIDLKDVIFYLSATALTLLLGSVSVEMRRWR